MEAKKLKAESKRECSWEGEKGGLRPLEERFRLRSSSYAPTSRLRLGAGPTAVGGLRLEAKENKDKGREAGRPWNGEFGMRNAECGMRNEKR